MESAGSWIYGVQELQRANEGRHSTRGSDGSALIWAPEPQPQMFRCLGCYGNLIDQTLRHPPVLVILVKAVVLVM